MAIRRKDKKKGRITNKYDIIHKFSRSVFGQSLAVDFQQTMIITRTTDASRCTDKCLNKIFQI